MMFLSFCKSQSSSKRSSLSYSAQSVPLSTSNVRWVKGLLLALLAANSFTWQARAFESSPSMIFVDSTYSGHEEITRQALNNTLKRIKNLDPENSLFDLSELQFNLKAEPRGLQGYKAKNLVISGNFASDFPKQATTVNLAEFWKNPKISDFENADNQVLHFLRNYIDDRTLASAQETCLNAQSNIQYVASQAVELYRRGEKAKALFLIGHALHTIQDSFSPIHAVRAGDSDNNDVRQICFYGIEMSKRILNAGDKEPVPLCYHKTPDSKDAIWNTNPARYKEALKNWSHEPSSQCDKLNSYPATEEEKASCLSSEARLARVASEKFLFLMFSELSPTNLTPRSSDSLASALQTQLFEGPLGVPELDQKMPLGIMRCGSLSTEKISGF